MTIAREVESVKLLVDEFSQFARFPTAQPVRCDLNDVIRTAVEVFEGACTMWTCGYGSQIIYRP